MAITPIIKRAGEGDVKLPLDNPAVLDALQRGNIQDVHKILADYGLTVEDFEQFAANQHSKYLSNIVQADPLYEGESSIPPPELAEFPGFDMSSSFSEADSQLAADMILNGMEAKYSSGKVAAIGKAAVSGKASAQGKSSGVSKEDIEAHINDANSLWTDILEPKLVEAQFAQQLQAKSAELENELQKILAMVRSGQIDDPAIVILALTKVNVEKNGLIFTQLGQKVQRYNEQSNKIIETLKNSGTSATDTATVMAAQQDLKAVGLNTQFLINDMNSVTQYITTAMNFGKSSLDAFHSTKMEIIRKIAVGS